MSEGTFDEDRMLAVVAKQAHQIKTLEESVDDLTDALDKLLKRKQKKEPAAWCWRYASADEAASTWAELSDFVDWLTRRFNLGEDSRSQLPKCWFRHGSAVEELTALMVAWKAAYLAGSTPSADPVAWIDRWLWPCISRLQDTSKRCFDEHHDDPSVPAPDWNALEETVRGDLDARAEGRGSPPVRLVSA